ncbi:MAG: UDP-N-acetylglucosamine 1-carboxyvinyltransferase [Opitutales bacterium]
MEVFRIRGGSPLRGTVTVSGSKNAALPMFAATLLSEEPSVLENVPDLSDVRFMADILRHLGAEVERLGPSGWRITPSSIDHRAPYDLVRKMRASVCLLGPLVGRLRKAVIPLPGGCVIGQRPIDLHLKAISKLGAKAIIREGDVYIDGSALRGGSMFLGGRQGSTVTGTANAIMAAVLAPGSTRIESAACEPEILDLCRMLQGMGARIDGIGSHILSIEGVNTLQGCRHQVIPDRIEAGTYCIAAAITNGEVRVEGARTEHLGAFADKMEQAGVELEADGTDAILARRHTDGLCSLEIITLPYPGFPTDLQAQACALACVSPGLSILTERIYPNRFMHVPELLRMGADVSIEGSSAIVRGVPCLSGAPVMASDLRASAALILAGLAAEGDTWVQRIYHLDRGYEHFDEKLTQLGADVERLPESALPQTAQNETVS